MKLVKEDIPFTMVANEVLKDKSLSFKAKGLYAYLFSKPDEWDFSGHRIMMETSDGKRTIFSGLKELEDNGYLVRDKMSTGKMKYTLKYSIKNLIAETAIRQEEPNLRFSNMPKRLIAETATISKIEGENKKEEKVRKNSDVPSQEISSIIKSFENTNISYAKWYSNTTQREACERLLKSFPLEQILKVTAILPKTNKIPYMPNISTPLQLEDKWSQLEAQLTKKKLESIKKHPTNVIFS